MRHLLILVALVTCYPLAAALGMGEQFAPMIGAGFSVIIWSA